MPYEQENIDEKTYRPSKRRNVVEGVVPKINGERVLKLNVNWIHRPYIELTITGWDLGYHWYRVIVIWSKSWCLRSCYWDRPGRPYSVGRNRLSLYRLYPSQENQVFSRRSRTPTLSKRLLYLIHPYFSYGRNRFSNIHLTRTLSS